MFFLFCSSFILLLKGRKRQKSRKEFLAQILKENGLEPVNVSEIEKTVLAERTSKPSKSKIGSKIVANDGKDETDSLQNLALGLPGDFDSDNLLGALNQAEKVEEKIEEVKIPKEEVKVPKVEIIAEKVIEKQVEVVVAKKEEEKPQVIQKKEEEAIPKKEEVAPTVSKKEEEEEEDFLLKQVDVSRMMRRLKNAKAPKNKDVGNTNVHNMAQLVSNAVKEAPKIEKEKKVTQTTSTESESKKDDEKKSANHKWVTTLTIRSHLDVVRGLAFNGSKGLVVSVSDDWTVRVFPTEDVEAKRKKPAKGQIRNTDALWTFRGHTGKRKLIIQSTLIN